MTKLLTEPPVTPTRHRGLPSDKPSTHLYTAGQINLEEQTSGWDWDSLSDYVPTPKKPCDSPRKTVQADSDHQVLSLPVTSKFIPDPCTRCLVQTVTDKWNDCVREKVRMLHRIY
jgi:hypothetical protein